MSFRHYWPRGGGVKANLDNVTKYEGFFFEGFPKVFSDILMVFYAYVVFFLASAAGFHLILNKIVFGEEEDCGDTEVRQELL